MDRYDFSLVELLIVIGILGVLATLIIPNFNNTTDDAKEQVTITEMREIQNAFRRFSADVMLKNNNSRMENILKFGLWPLMKEDDPGSSITYTDYDVETGIGRRGPYLQMEGEITISSSPTAGGQASESSGTTVPVMKDTYGGYYRVMCPEINSEDSETVKKNKLRRMVLVCTGTDRTLDTLNSNLDDDGNIKVPDGKDDKVLRLMPLATY